MQEELPVEDCNCGGCSQCRCDDEVDDEDVLEISSPEEPIILKTPTKNKGSKTSSSKLKTSRRESYFCQDCSLDFASLKQVSNHLGQTHAKNVQELTVDFWDQFSGKGFCVSCLTISEEEKCVACSGFLKEILIKVG